MLHVAEYREISQLSRALPAWEELLERTGRGATPGEYAEVLRRDTSEARVLVVSAGGNPLGLLPMMQRIITTRFRSARLITLEADLPPVGANAALVWLAGMRRLNAVRRTWDGLDLEVADEPTQRRVRNALRLVGFNGEETSTEEGMVTFSYHCRRRKALASGGCQPTG